MTGISFMLLALPRSGTTWASAWLTTERSVCWHDAAGRGLPQEFDGWPSKKPIRGISCTGTWLWPDWVNAHPARKVVLERPVHEVNVELAQMGLGSMPERALECFRAIRAPRVPWTMLWESPQEVWNLLMPGELFDAERHAELARMHIQPMDTPRNAPTAEHLRRAVEDFRRASWQ